MNLRTETAYKADEPGKVAPHTDTHGSGSEATACGVPQGGPLSPLLANIMLDDLDKELEARGHRFSRYADDFLVFVRSRSSAERVLRTVSRGWP